MGQCRCVSFNRLVCARVWVCVFVFIATQMSGGQRSTLVYLHVFRRSEICVDFISKHIRNTSTQHVICSFWENTFLWENLNLFRLNVHSSWM